MRQTALDWIEVHFGSEFRADDLIAAYQLLGIPSRRREYLGGSSVQVPQTTTETQRRDASMLAWPRPTQRWREIVTANGY